MTRLTALLGAAALIVGCAVTPEEATRARARKLMTDAMARQGDVQLRCDPDDAEVNVDGVPRGLCTDFDEKSGGLTLGAGFHRIEVKKAGYVPYETSIDPAGARAILTIRLTKLAENEGAGP